MKEILLDGKAMTNRKEVHTYLKGKLDVPGYYGNNLDALWDILSTYNKSLKISLIHPDDLLRALGNYGEGLIQVFEDAAKINQNLTFQIK